MSLKKERKVIMQWENAANPVYGDSSFRIRLLDDEEVVYNRAPNTFLQGK